ncbi:MAG: ABC transporter permease [Acidobacteria bacterium]|nr:ABC transporter permease [Acidobacteriota bacterium]
MTLPVSLAVALRALGRNRLQTALTMLGMTIGVAAVLAMIALGTGAEAAIDQQVRAAGMNLIVVTAGNYKIKTEDDFGGVIDHQAAFAPDRAPFRLAPAVWRPDDAPVFRLIGHPEDDPMEKHNHPTASQRLGDTEAGLGSAATLTSADAEAIRRIRGVQYVAEGLHQNAHVAFGAKRWFTRLHGTDVELPSIRRAWTFSSGRFFSAREQRNRAQAIVLGNVVAQTLFGNEDPVGRDVIIWKQAFRVVGVIGNSSWMVAAAKGDDQFDAVYVPYTTVHALLNLSKLNDITITSASTGDVTRVAKEVTELLRARHGIGVRNPDDFTVTTQAREALAKGSLRPEVARAVVGNVAGLEKVTLEQLGKTLDRASRTMTALLAATAAVSLLVGGIGIMNIMLLSVTERTREIGIRRAVGARARDVLRQFLVEAMTLGLAGGGAGIVVGLAAALAISRTLRWSTAVSPGAVALSFGIAALVGVFFGWYPARQAARVHPIESLRFE